VRKSLPLNVLFCQTLSIFLQQQSGFPVAQNKNIKSSGLLHILSTGADMKQ
jgi:hypothetical protein